MEVLVSAMGCLCVAGDLDSATANLWAGKLSGPVMPERLVRLATRLGLGELSHPAFCLEDKAFPEGWRHSSRDTLALAEAVSNSVLVGLGKRELAETAVVIGSTSGNALHFLSDYKAFKLGESFSGDGFRDFFKGNPSEALAGKYGLLGPALTVGTACCSGTDAIGLGASLIATGRCERVLAGGADALSLIPYIGFRRLMIYSDYLCRPFDKNRSGLNLGEGAAVMLLESPKAAKQRSSHPLALVRSYATATDAYHLTAPHPEALGLRRVIREALATAGLTSRQLAFVSAHGTATKDNDLTEALAIRTELPGVPVWAVKGVTGHTLGAAGAIEAVLAVVALNKGSLPVSPGFTTFDPSLGVSPALAGPIKGKVAVSISLGFGGGNSALILEAA